MISVSSFLVEKKLWKMCRIEFELKQKCYTVTEGLCVYVSANTHSFQKIKLLHLKLYPSLSYTHPNQHCAIELTLIHPSYPALYYRKHWITGYNNNIWKCTEILHLYFIGSRGRQPKLIKSIQPEIIFTS